jgi:hypothetical protein
MKELQKKVKDLRKKASRSIGRTGENPDQDAGGKREKMEGELERDFANFPVACRLFVVFDI